MADSEGKNSESQAISLGIKWIKKNKPEVRLLVSYSGRVEGNYGYIYQATNWEYLGYFISNGFYILDGIEHHLIGVCRLYKKYGKDYKTMRDYLCDNYHNVIQYDSKQFIYIKRLDKSLTPAKDILSYPKPATEFPIQTSITKYQIDRNFVPEKQVYEIPDFYYNEDEELSHRRKKEDCQYLLYDKSGNFVAVYKSIAQILKDYPDYSDSGIRNMINTGRRHKDFFFNKIPYGMKYEEKIPVDVLCWIDGKPFYKQKEIVAYTGVSRQAVSACVKRKGKKIGGKDVEWN